MRRLWKYSCKKGMAVSVYCLVVLFLTLSLALLIPNLSMRAGLILLWILCLLFLILTVYVGVRTKWMREPEETDGITRTWGRLSQRCGAVIYFVSVVCSLLFVVPLLLLAIPFCLMLLLVSIPTPLTRTEALLTEILRTK